MLKVSQCRAGMVFVRPKGMSSLIICQKLIAREDSFLLAPFEYLNNDLNVKLILAH